MYRLPCLRWVSISAFIMLFARGLSDAERTWWRRRHLEVLALTIGRDVSFADVFFADRVMRDVLGEG
jgi:hypothetical protein